MGFNAVVKALHPSTSYVGAYGVHTLPVKRKLIELAN
jgi:hypothetical protein